MKYRIATKTWENNMCIAKDDKGWIFTTDDAHCFRNSRDARRVAESFQAICVVIDDEGMEVE